MRGYGKRLSDQRNMIAIMSGVLFLVLFMLVGLALDSIRASQVSGRMVAALDAAALGGAKMLDQGRAKDAAVSAHVRAIFAERARALKLRGVTIKDVVVHMNRRRTSVTVTALGAVAPTFGRALTLSSAEFRRTSRMTFKGAPRPLGKIASLKHLDSSSGRVAAILGVSEGRSETAPGAPYAGTNALAAAMSVAPFGSLSVAESERAAQAPTERSGDVHLCADVAPMRKRKPVERETEVVLPLQFVSYIDDCRTAQRHAPTMDTTRRQEAAKPGPVKPSAPAPEPAGAAVPYFGAPDYV